MKKKNDLWEISNRNWNVPLDDERNLTIDQFCWAEGLSEDQFDYLVVNGLGPDVHDLVIGLGHRITARARREWHARIAIELRRAHGELD